MDTASATISFGVKASGTNAVQGTATGATHVQKPSWPASYGEAVKLSFGTGSGQIDWIVFQPRELAASASETLALDGTGLANVFGLTNASGFTNLKYLIFAKIDNPDGSTAATSITIGNAAANPLTMNLGGTTPTYTIYHGGFPFVLGRPAGYTVDGSNSDVKVTNDDGTNKATYLLFAFGVKA